VKAEAILLFFLKPLATGWLLPILVGMKIIGAFDAKTHLSDLLEKVAGGESYLITKRGKPVASLSPVSTSKKHGPKDHIDGFRKEFAKSLKHFPVREIAALKEAGRR
jgi:prevent-host-death family protein